MARGGKARGIEREKRVLWGWQNRQVAVANETAAVRAWKGSCDAV